MSKTGFVSQMGNDASKDEPARRAGRRVEAGRRQNLGDGQSLGDFLLTTVLYGGSKTELEQLGAEFAGIFPNADGSLSSETYNQLNAYFPTQIRKPSTVAAECQSDALKVNISFDKLLKSALCWRPDRIVMGEVRGIGAHALLDSLNTGRARSLATIHANSPEKAARRFANLMRNLAQITFSDPEAEIAEAVDLVVHVERLPGRRILPEVPALRGYARDVEHLLIEPAFEVKHATT